jgi:hypothetical protein
LFFFSLISALVAIDDYDFFYLVCLSDCRLCDRYFPGSGAVLSMSHGLNYGVKKASTTILGLQAGLLLILAIAGAGVGSILLASEFALTS